MMRFVCRFMVLFFVSNILFAVQHIDGISILSVSSKEDERVFYMDADIDIQLPQYIVEALYSGIPLPMLLQVKVKETRNWWPDRLLVTVEQRYVLHYYPLLDVFKLNNLTTGSSTSHTRLDLALSKIGMIRHFPVLDKEHFITDNRLYAALHLKVDVEALPKPLRTEALLGGNWDIGSAWKEWPL